VLLFKTVNDEAGNIMQRQKETDKSNEKERDVTSRNWSIHLQPLLIKIFKDSGLLGCCADSG
jgi:hypothetical protein